MSIKPIRTRVDHRAAVARIEALWEAAPGTPEHDEIEILGTLVDAFEKRHWPALPPSPIEAIRFHMDQNGLRLKDLGDIIGSASRASEIMGARRSLTVEMIRKIHRAWNIPLASLIAEVRDVA